MAAGTSSPMGDRKVPILGPADGRTAARRHPTRPRWSEVLRALREARGATQAGWAARLGVSRKTVLRWENGQRAPDPGAEAAILAYCRQAGLLRPFERGPLAGLTLTEEHLQALFAEARWRVGGGASATTRFGDPPADRTRNTAPATPAAPAGPRRQDGSQSAPALPTNLPAHVTSFVGRERELAAVRRVQAGTRLLTLTGPGGGGKTRLALALAEELLWAYPHGVWYVDLAPVSDPDLVPQALAAALALRGSGQQPPTEALAKAL